MAAVKRFQSRHFEHLVEFNRFPELSRTSGLFPGLSSPGKCQNKIPGLSRFSRTRTNPGLFLEDTEYIVSKNRRAYFPCFLSVENEGCICLAFPIAVGPFVMYIQLNILQNLLLDREQSLGQRFFEGVGEVGGRALIYNLQLAFNY